jgi:hypothetical protein
MKYLLLKNYDHYAIVNDDADFIVGRVCPLDGRGFRETWPLMIATTTWSPSFNHLAMPSKPLLSTMNETRHGGTVKAQHGTPSGAIRAADG